MEPHVAAYSSRSGRFGSGLWFGLRMVRVLQRGHFISRQPSAAGSLALNSRRAQAAQRTSCCNRITPVWPRLARGGSGRNLGAVGGGDLVGFAPFEGGVSAPFAPHSVSAISTPMDRPISLVRHSAPPASGPVAVVAVILWRRGHVLHRPGRGIDRGGGLLGLVDHLDHLRGCELMHHVVGIAERDGL